MKKKKHEKRKITNQGILSFPQQNYPVESLCKHHTFGQGVGKKTRRTFSLDFCNLSSIFGSSQIGGQRVERSKQVTCFFFLFFFFYEHKTCSNYHSSDFAVFLSFKRLSYLLITCKWQWSYIFPIDYKLNLRLVKISGNPDGRGGLWYWKSSCRGGGAGGRSWCPG